MKKEILALLVVVACWGSTLQANDWKNAPISEVQKAAEQGDRGVGHAGGGIDDAPDESAQAADEAG